MMNISRKIAAASLGFAAALSAGLLSTNAYAGRVVVIDGPPRHYHRALPRAHHYRGPKVIRSHGWPHFGVLGFTAVTLKVLDNMNEEQQRAHEAALARAATANVGETIIWQDAGASGSVTTTRVGTSTNGYQCREFQHTVNIGNKAEVAYGTACLQPDGSWKVAP